MSPEDAHAIGKAKNLIENNLSSVKISHNAKGNTTWEIKIKAEDPYKALAVANDIDVELRKQYGN